jgi:DNA helicase-2/ATP-dependent DNA helicase PcrA
MTIILPGFWNKLDEYQFKAATSGDGAKLCLAAAGSGKTQTYAHRVVHLVANGVKEDNILATTFTKKAAEEMKERISKVAKANNIIVNVDKMWIGTFHSLGIKAARENCHFFGYPENFTIDNDDRQVAAVKRLIKDSYSLRDVKQLKPYDVLSAISYARNVGQDYKSIFEQRIRATENYGALVDVAEAYERQKRERNVFDYDDMLIYWLYILTKSSGIRNTYQDQFHYILVDEYQDTNYIQNEIIDILAAKHENLFVVGDDSQSVYRFRGAEIGNILNFNQRYPDCETFALSNNYRSTPEIVNLSTASISNNTAQLKKEVKTPNKSGQLPKIIITEDERSQNINILKMIQSMNSKGVPYKEIAVLYRNNAQSVDLEQQFQINHVPYIKKGPQFWKGAHMQLALSWLNLIQNPIDSANIIECAQMFKGIGKSAITDLTMAIQSVDNHKDFLSGDLIVNPKKPNLYDDFRKKLIDIDEILAEAEDPIGECINYLISFLEPYIIDNPLWKDNGKERAEDLQVISGMADRFDSLIDMLEAIALQDDHKNDDDQDAVTMSTLHGSKGLEWDVVFIIGLVDGVFPSKYVETNEALEEERRLFYVGITRARQRLYMFSPKLIKQYGKFTAVDPSIFLTELPEELVDKRKV